MTKFKINLDYKRKDPKPGEEKDYLSNSELTQNYIEFAARSKYEKGLEGQLRRCFGRIQRKLDDAVDNKHDEVELEDAEIDFIVGIFDNKVLMPTALAKYLSVLEDEVDRVNAERKKK